MKAASSIRVIIHTIVASSQDRLLKLAPAKEGSVGCHTPGEIAICFSNLVLMNCAQDLHIHVSFGFEDFRIKDQILVFGHHVQSRYNFSAITHPFLDGLAA